MRGLGPVRAPAWRRPRPRANTACPTRPARLPRPAAATVRATAAGAPPLAPLAPLALRRRCCSTAPAGSPPRRPPGLERGLAPPARRVARRVAHVARLALRARTLCLALRTTLCPTWRSDIASCPPTHRGGRARAAPRRHARRSGRAAGRRSGRGGGLARGRAGGGPRGPRAGRRGPSRAAREAELDVVAAAAARAGEHLEGMGDDLEPLLVSARPVGVVLWRWCGGVGELERCRRCRSEGRLERV